MADLIVEVDRFRSWAGSYPKAGAYGEWECDYESWDSLYEAVLSFVANRPFESWSRNEQQAVLYAIARDNEFQYLVGEICKSHPEVICDLTRTALVVGERDDRWQLAVELANLGRTDPEVEGLLLILAGDDHEYVRRNSLQSLLRIGSPAVEKLAVAEWYRPDEDQEWSRMNALYCLHTLGSPQLQVLLVHAENDSRQHLRGYAERIRRGESLD